MFCCLVSYYSNGCQQPFRFVVEPGCDMVMDDSCQASNEQNFCGKPLNISYPVSFSSTTSIPYCIPTSSSSSSSSASLSPSPSPAFSAWVFIFVAGFLRLLL